MNINEGINIINIEREVIYWMIIGGILGIISIVPYHSVLGLGILWLSQYKEIDIYDITILKGIYSIVCYCLMNQVKEIFFKKCRQSLQLTNNNIKKTLNKQNSYISLYITCIFFSIPLCTLIKNLHLYKVFLVITVVYTAYSIYLSCLNYNPFLILTITLPIIILCKFIINSENMIITGLLFSIINLPLFNKTLKDYEPTSPSDSSFEEYNLKSEYNLFNPSNYIYGDSNSSLFFHVLILSQTLLNNSQRDTIGTLLNFSPDLSLYVIPTYSLSLISSFLFLLLLFAFLFIKPLMILYITLLNFKTLHSLLTSFQHLIQYLTSGFTIFLSISSNYTIILYVVPIILLIILSKFFLPKLPPSPLFLKSFLLTGILS